MQIFEQALSLLKLFAPLAVGVIAILTAWGIIKWGKRLGEAFKGLSESPVSFMFGIIVVALFLYFFFKYVSPLLN